MNRGFFLLLSIFFLLPSVTEAETSWIISEERASEFFYQVKKNQETYIWMVEGRQQSKAIKETGENEAVLEAFRTSVENAHSQRITLWILGVAIGLILLFYSFLFIKQKRILKEAWPASVFPVGVLLSIIFNASIEWSRHLQSADHFFQALMHYQ